jgi:hypothetical protein
MIVNQLKSICNTLFVFPVFCIANVHVLVNTIPVLIYHTKNIFPLVTKVHVMVDVSIAVEFAGTIQLTVAVVLHILPTASSKVKMNVPFHVKVYPDDQSLFVIVIGSDQLNVAITFPLVIVTGS